MVALPFFVRALFLAAPVLLLSGCHTTEPRISRKDPALVQAAHHLKLARKISRPAEERAALYLDAAALASREFTHPAARPLYNSAAAELTDLLRDTDDGRLWARPLTLSADGTTYRLRVQPGARQGFWAPDYFTDFRPSGEIRRKHIRKSVLETGVGGTLAGIRKTPGFGLDRRAPFEPKLGFVAPVTATLDFRGNDATLTLNDPAETKTVRVRGATEPLAADFTAPIAFHPARNELWQGFLGLIQGEKYLSSTGLYMLHPYDPDRIPVVLVHGLASTPQMWVNVINEVEADPQLRGRFQFWVFRYPTGNPLVYSALRFREELTRVEKMYSLPKGCIVIGHSMGGLVSRLQAIDPDRAIWDRWTGKKADALFAKLPPDDLVKRAMIFDANPKVRRLVFICVPHRGSELALGSLGAIAIRLITLPASLVTTLNQSLGEVLETVGGKPNLPTSITSLSPKSRTLLAIDKILIRAPHHSIIGDRGKGDTPNSTDGVVPYWSSHLDSAESELIVPGPHGSYDLPATIEELVRILHQHINQPQTAVRSPSQRIKR